MVTRVTIAFCGVLALAATWVPATQAQTAPQGRSEAASLYVAAGTFTRACAARDIQVLSLIEERESADAISAQASSDAILSVMHARMVCFEGRVLDALAIYDRVSESVLSNYLLSGRNQ